MGTARYLPARAEKEEAKGRIKCLKAQAFKDPGWRQGHIPPLFPGPAACPAEESG